VRVVLELDGGIDAGQHGEGLLAAVGGASHDAERLARSEAVGDALDRVDLFAAEAEGFAALSTPMPIRLER
jgi:hypothetical protein